MPQYETLTVHITTHRLILVPDGSGSSKPRALEAPLSAVRQTEFYTGFMRSSPKITLFLGRSPVPEPSRASLSSSSTSSLPSPAPAAPVPAASSWTCGVCGFPNPLPPGPSNTPPPATKCQLCGVAYATSKSMTPPVTRSATPASVVSPAPKSPAEPAPTPPPPEPESDQIACPACTFLNHKWLSTCEICGTGLPKPSRKSDKDKADKVDKPEVKLPPPGPEKHDVVRLSFRKDGVKEAYRRLKGVLSDKVWERVAAGPPRRQASSDENGDKQGGAGIGELLNRRYS